MSFSFASSKTYPSNHKTIFVLDHTPYFGISSENPIEFDFLKSRTPGFMPLNPICKSLWTCSIESAIEYCRIVWDLFPQGKLVKFIASDTGAHILNTWSPSQQTLNYIINGMSLIGMPPPHMRALQPGLDYTVLHGLRAAVEALTEYTEQQLEKKKTGVQGVPKLLNRCRVICITSTRDNDSMKRLEEIFQTVLLQRNKQISGSDMFIPIDHCHLVIINTFPVNTESQVNSHPPRNLSPVLTTEVHSIKAPLIPSKIASLVLEHYDLASTTVTGIPMKEEQSASSSSNYDVEIFHSSLAHAAILKGNVSDAAAIRTVQEGCEYETVTLKWCTPRGCSASELHNCTSVHRITPVDVNSRPSSCLIGFLINGRSVMLEMPRKSGGKITSHLLTAHGGEVFIHTLYTARSVLEDPPSISEGVGGRVTDYRITDFGLLIKQNRLFPVKQPEYASEGALVRVKARLNRHTKYWPLTISSTFIFNLKGIIDPLPTLITKDTMTETEMLQCQQVIYSLIALEKKHEPLHPPSTGQRMKGHKREEQYKLMWKELETFIKNNLHSDNHKQVYSCLLECHKFNFDEDKVELDQALRELDEMGKVEPDLQRASVIRATTDSPMSPPPLASIGPSPLQRTAARNATIYAAAVAPPKTLFDIFTVAEKTKTRPDFFGRAGGDLVAKLYPSLKGEGDRGARGEAMEVE